MRYVKASYASCYAGYVHERGINYFVSSHVVKAICLVKSYEGVNDNA